jgi:hypothetical protein
MATRTTAAKTYDDLERVGRGVYRRRHYALRPPHDCLPCGPTDARVPYRAGLYRRSRLGSRAFSGWRTFGWVGPPDLDKVPAWSLG